MSVTSVVMSARVAEKQAIACLKRIDAERGELIAAEVARLRSASERSWFRRLFRREVPSDATLRERILDDIYCMDISCYGWTIDQAAMRVLAAAQHAAPFPGLITVSAEDLLKVFR